VSDEDDTLLGDFLADAVAEGAILLEWNAVQSALPEHIAQLLGYLKPARLEHGVPINFEAQKSHLKMDDMSKARDAADS